MNDIQTGDVCLTERSLSSPTPELARQVKMKIEGCMGGCSVDFILHYALRGEKIVHSATVAEGMIVEDTFAVLGLATGYTIRAVEGLFWLYYVQY